MSRAALSPSQFDLLIATQRDFERKRRLDKGGIYCPPPKKTEKTDEPARPQP